jgi:DUF971 family protein
MRIPTAIELHKASKTLTLKYANGDIYQLPAEFLRVHSPSAEVQGHGKSILQTGKLNVGLTRIDDGHDSGLFTWNYLDELGQRQPELWQDYLDTLRAAGKTRDPAESVVKLML